MARNKKSDSVELRLLEAELATRGLDLDSLAARLGLTIGALRRYRRLGFPSPFHRAVVEKVLDYFPIWTPATTLAVRQRCFETLGVDPACIGFLDLQKLARERGVSTTGLNQSELISTFLAHFAVQPNTPKNV